MPKNKKFAQSYFVGYTIKRQIKRGIQILRRDKLVSRPWRIFANWATRGSSDLVPWTVLTELRILWGDVRVRPKPIRVKAR